MGVDIANDDEATFLSLSQIRHEYTSMIAYLHASSRRFTPIILGLLQVCVGLILSLGFILVFKITDEEKASTHAERFLIYGVSLGIIFFSGYLLWFGWHMKKIANDHRFLADLAAARDHSIDDVANATAFVKLQHLVKTQGFVRCWFIQFTPEEVAKKGQILKAIIIVAIAFVGTGSGGHGHGQ